ncbi:MAG: hypothetical protein NZ992_00125 [Candidatus Korarchaeum sp.]|nr:hypothetical protein [Candidatus Korarchaeum sp.]MDW8093327.1 hypothetical protein [Nitrososphaerota archaeon]
MRVTTKLNDYLTSRESNADYTVLHACRSCLRFLAIEHIISILEEREGVCEVCGGKTWVYKATLER